MTILILASPLNADKIFVLGNVLFHVASLSLNTKQVSVIDCDWKQISCNFFVNKA